MKSVIQEASSIAKAVEQGWEKAGKPKDFSIKVLEEPIKNFLGFTKRSAKVAIYFDEAKQQYRDTAGQQRQQRPQQRYRPEQRRTDRSERSNGQEGQPRQQQQREQREPRQQREQRQQNQPQREQREQREPRSESREPRQQFQPREQRDMRDQRQQQPREHQREQRDREPREMQNAEEITPQWTPAMLDYTKSWINETLASMNLQNISYAVEPSDLHLRIIFYDNVVPDPNQEKKLFASFATLIYEALKKQFNVPLRGHKIVLLHATAYDLQSRR